MGGVDLAGMLVALYRIELKTRRWYLQILAQMIDISLNNAWLLRRRELRLQNIKDKDMTLKGFRYAIYEGLTKESRSRGRERNVNFPVKIIKTPTVPRPTEEVQHDLVGHFPTYTSRGRCKYCVNGKSVIQCSKFNVRLCLKENSNCFVGFHSK